MPHSPHPSHIGCNITCNTLGNNPNNNHNLHLHQSHHHIGSADPGDIKTAGTVTLEIDYLGGLLAKIPNESPLYDFILTCLTCTSAAHVTVADLLKHKLFEGEVTLKAA